MTFLLAKTRLVRSTTTVLTHLMMIWLGLVSSISHALEAEVVLFPRSQLQRNQDNGFPVKLLTEALNASSPGRYILQATEFYVPREKSVELLKLNRIQVMWDGVKQLEDEQVMRLDVPILKGFMGWRVMLVPAGQQDMLRDVRTLEQLKAFPFLSASHWPETAYYKKAGLSVFEEREYETLFNRLESSPNTVFPRLALMVVKEHKNHHHLNLAIDKYVLLKYPYTLNYYLSANEPELIEAIRKGLEILESTGQHDALLNAHFQPLVKDLELDNRHVIEMPVQ